MFISQIEELCKRITQKDMNERRVMIVTIAYEIRLYFDRMTKDAILDFLPYDDKNLERFLIPISDGVMGPSKSVIVTLVTATKDSIVRQGLDRNLELDIVTDTDESLSEQFNLSVEELIAHLKSYYSSLFFANDDIQTLDRTVMDAFVDKEQLSAESKTHSFNEILAEVLREK